MAIGMLLLVSMIMVHDLCTNYISRVTSTGATEKASPSKKKAVPSKIKWSVFAKPPAAPRDDTFLTGTTSYNYIIYMTTSLSRCGECYLGTNDDSDDSTYDFSSQGLDDSSESTQQREADAVPVAGRKSSTLLKGMSPAPVHTLGDVSGRWDGCEAVTQHLRKTMKYADIFTMR